MHHSIWEWRLYDAKYYAGMEAVRCIIVYESGGCMILSNIWEWRLYDA